MGQIVNWIIFSFPLAIFKKLKIVGAVFDWMLEALIVSLLVLRQTIIANNGLLLRIGASSVSRVIEQITAIITYGIYGLTAITTIAISIVKTGFLVIEWFFSTALSATSGIFIATRQAVLTALKLVLWPLAAIREYVKVFFMAYTRLIRLLGQPKTHSAKKAKKRKFR